MKMLEFRLKFHWSLFLMVTLTLFQHWLRWWLGAVQATSHYLNQWWLVYRRIYASLGLNELMDWTWTAARWDEKHRNFFDSVSPYIRGLTVCYCVCEGPCAACCNGVMHSVVDPGDCRYTPAISKPPWWLDCNYRAIWIILTHWGRD